MRRSVGAYSPQNGSTFTTRTKKLYFSYFNIAFCQKLVALATPKETGTGCFFSTHNYFPLLYHWYQQNTGAWYCKYLFLDQSHVHGEYVKFAAYCLGFSP